jgi:hypothetical protein
MRHPRTPRTHSVRRVRAISVALVSAVAGVTLLGTAGCSQGSVALSASSNTRSPVERDGGNEVTVPALWADTKSATSGIEPARIWATEDGASAFTIELNDVQAKGAGPQWTAASAAAAAVGSMVSGLNPGTIDVNFAITGPIDGPSAGGILTVGVLSALLNAPLRGDMTMTGTISPDGSIGPVGGVDLKLKAAAAQGYSRVLLPLANMTLRDGETDTTISAVEAGRKLGLDVRGVGNVQEAFTLFTDGKFSYPAAPPFVLPAAVSSVAQRQSENLLALLSDELQATAADADTSVSASLLSDARASANDGDAAASYGIASQGLYVASREQAASRMRSVIADSGLSAASLELSAEISSQRAMIRTLETAISQDTAGLGYEQLISMPNVLGWLTYDTAILNALQAKLDAGELDQAAAERYSRILSDTRVDISVLFPDQREILTSAPSRPSPGDAKVAAYLSDYTTFLVRAGQAQQEYVEKVVLRGEDPRKVATLNDVGLLLPVVLDLADSVSRIPAGTSPLAVELLESSTAITYYIATTSLIAAVQGFGLTEFGIGSDPSSAESPLVLDAAVMTSARAVNELSALLAQSGLDASLPFWAASTGVGAAEALTGSPQETAIDVRALNELYFDGINVFMLQSGPVS